MLSVDSVLHTPHSKVCRFRLFVPHARVVVFLIVTNQFYSDVESRLRTRMMGTRVFRGNPSQTEIDVVGVSGGQQQVSCDSHRNGNKCGGTPMGMETKCRRGDTL